MPSLHPMPDPMPDPVPIPRQLCGDPMRLRWEFGAGQVAVSCRVIWRIPRRSKSDGCPVGNASYFSAPLLTVDYKDANCFSSITSTRASLPPIEVQIVGAPLRCSSPQAPIFSSPPITSHHLPLFFSPDRSAQLVITKGDANYRRLIGDLHWRHDVSFWRVLLIRSYCYAAEAKARATPKILLLRC